MLHAKMQLSEPAKALRLELTGHTGWQVSGRDLVCASASILACTLARHIGELQAEAPAGRFLTRIELAPGDSHIRVACADGEGYRQMRGIFMTVLTGYRLLAENYPQYVNACLYDGDTGKAII